MKNKNIKYLLNNKRALHNYDIVARYKSGLVLKSSTIKKIFNYRLSLTGSYGWIKKNEIYLKNFEENEDIKLLLNRDEINKIIKYKNEKKYLIIPENLYLNNNLIKMTLTLAKYNKDNIKNKAKLKRIKEKDQKKIDKLFN